MNSLNTILLEGNLVRDPVTRFSPRGARFCEFTVATNRYYKKTAGDAEFQHEVSYFDIQTYGREAERCGTELKKGRGVRIIGKLKQSRWQDQEGKNKDRVKILADNVYFKAQYEKKEEINTIKANDTVEAPLPF